jgi:hypothetical protein
MTKKKNEKKAPKPKSTKKRASKYEEKLKLKGGFIGAINELVKDK